MKAPTFRKVAGYPGLAELKWRRWDRWLPPLRGPAEQAASGGQQHQGQHHRQIFDDEPADRDTPPLGIDEAPLLQRPQQNHGAGDRQRSRTPGSPPSCQPKAQAKPMPSSGGDRDLHDGAGNGDGADREQVIQGEMQADAEHQQDDADLGEFSRQRRIGDKARGEGTDQHARREDSRRSAMSAPGGRMRPNTKARTRPPTSVAISGV